MEMEKAIFAKSWNEYEWPEWVPVEVRQQIESFWGEQNKRYPKQWVDNAVENKAPKFGARIRVRDIRGNLSSGKFIFAWNNIGRLISETGEIIYCGFDGFEVSRDLMWQKPLPQDYQSFTTATVTVV